MIRDRLSNILTSLFLIAGVMLVVVFMYTKWDVYIEPIGSGGTTLMAGIVAFVVTFLVLIIVTLCIVALKWITDRKHKQQTISKVSSITPKQQTDRILSMDLETELVAVIMSAIRAYELENGRSPVFTEFKVRELIASGSSWRIMTRDEFNSAGG